MTNPIYLPAEVRELISRIDESAICDGTDATISDDLFTELVALISQPQPAELEQPEVVAWQDAEEPLYTTAERHQMLRWADNGYPIAELMTIAQHHRITAQLRAECERLRGERDMVRRELEIRKKDIDWYRNR